MKMFSRTLAAAALAVVGVSAQAAIVASATNFAGNVSISGFGTITGLTGSPPNLVPILPNVNSFTVNYTNLSGSIVLQALPNGWYNVSAATDTTLTGFGPTPININVPTLTPVYYGFLGSTGLTPGLYPFTFGNSIGSAIPFGFTLSYDGDVSPQVMSALAGFGLPFVNPDGAGTLTVAGVFNADGTTAQLTFSESDLTWTGFANTLALADYNYGNNNLMDGSFLVRSATVQVPEPATLALVGLGLLGAAVARRRRA